MTDETVGVEADVTITITEEPDVDEGMMVPGPEDEPTEEDEA